MKQHHTPTENEDPIWEILDQAPPQQASPLFARNVVRAVRLDLDQARAPWWKKLTNRKSVIILTSCAACAVAVLPMIFPSSTVDPLPVTSGKTEILAPETTEAINDTEIFGAIVEDDDMVSEFLVVISENPEILSQEEIASLMNF